MAKVSNAHIPPAVAITGNTSSIGKKNGEIIGLISNMWLKFLYTVQLVICDVCTEFQNSRKVVHEKFHI